MFGNPTFSEFLYEVQQETYKAGMPSGSVSVDQRDGYVSAQVDLGEIVLLVRVIVSNDRLTRYELEYEVYLDLPGETIRTFTYLDDAAEYFFKCYESGVAEDN